MRDYVKVEMSVVPPQGKIKTWGKIILKPVARKRSGGRIYVKAGSCSEPTSPTRKV